MDKSSMWVIGFFVVAFACSLFGGSPSIEPHFDGVEVVEADFGISAIISAVIAAASAAASAGAAANQASKAKKKEAEAQQRLDAWYDNEMAGNILDRADSRSMLNEYRSTMEEQNRKYLQNAIKGGASDEAKVAYAQSANKGYADAISKIAAEGQRRKDVVAEKYLQGKMDADTRMADMYLQSGQQMSNAISSAGGSMASAVSGMNLGTAKTNSASQPLDNLKNK